MGRIAHLRVIQLGSGGSSSATASSIATSVSAGNGCDASHLQHRVQGMERMLLLAGRSSQGSICGLYCSRRASNSGSIGNEAQGYEAVSPSSLYAGRQSEGTQLRRARTAFVSSKRHSEGKTAEHMVIVTHERMNRG